MITYEKYDEDLKQLGITDEQEKTEIINSLYRLAIIVQNNYKLVTSYEKRQKKK